MVKKLCFLALTLMLTAPIVSRQLSDGPFPMPLCPPGADCSLQSR
jgi:hypothetical protein